MQVVLHERRGSAWDIEDAFEHLAVKGGSPLLQPHIIVPSK